MAACIVNHGNLHWKYALSQLEETRLMDELLAKIERYLDSHHYAAAADRARAYLRTYADPDAERALAAYCAGRALCRDAPLTADLGPADLQEAVVHFDHARALPLPKMHREEACRLAGGCLERLGQTADAIEHYEIGLAINGYLAGPIRLRLIALWARLPKPDLDRMEREADAVAADAKINPDEKARALLSVGETAFRLGNWKAAERRLERVQTSFAATPSARRTHLLLAQVHHHAGRFAPALREAERYLKTAKATDADALPAAFVLADSLLNTGKPAEALAAFRQLTYDFPTRPEGQASALRAVACHIRLGRGPEAMAQLKRVMKAYPVSVWSANPWTGEADLTALVDECRRFFFGRGEYEQVVALAECTSGIVPRKACLESLATAHRLIAERADREAAAAPKGERAAKTEEARLASVRAGDALVALSRVTAAEPIFVEHLWSAVRCYREAGAYKRESSALERYIKKAFTASMPSGDRYVEASYYLGECYAALGRTEEALTIFRRVVAKRPRNAFAYQARLAAAQCCLVLKDYEGAETALTAIVDNTEGPYFSPRSTAWRRALFLLGETLHRRGKHDAAIRRLTEAVERYPDDPEAQRGRYLLAGCHRASARERTDPAAKADRPALAEELRTAARERLLKAADLYRAVIDRYEARETAGGPPLDLLDATQQRNAYFFLGDCYAEARDYERAIDAYETAGFRYRDDLRTVSAFVRITNVLRRQGKERLAGVAGNKAREMLKRVPGNDTAKRPTSMTREQWLAWLDWAGRLE